MANPKTAKFIDQIGREVLINQPVNKIISLVPSQTELLADLGLEEKVVGITKFCIHPVDWFKTKTRVGGTKTVHIDHIKKLNPDLIIANKEENEKSQIEELANSFPVWVSDINNLNEAYDMINAIGKLTNVQPEAENLVIEIKQRFKSLKSLIKSKTVAYVIWNDPIMCTGKGTFIDEQLSMCGFINIVDEMNGRYPEVTQGFLNEKKPDFIFLSSEPFPFKEKHVAAYQSMFPYSKVIVVDGEIFSWYGSRLKKAPAYLNGLIKLVEKEIDA